MIEGVSQGLQAPGGIGSGSYNDISMSKVEDTRPLRTQFEELWNSRRYTRPNAPKSRWSCPTFESEVIRIFSGVKDADLPVGVMRTGGRIGSSDVINHVDYFRALLDRYDAEAE